MPVSLRRAAAQRSRPRARYAMPARRGAARHEPARGQAAQSDGGRRDGVAATEPLAVERGGAGGEIPEQGASASVGQRLLSG